MPETYATRPTPEQLLHRVQAEEEYERRGRLKIFLGYASGVGKSFRMLDEGRRRKLRGEDVVIGAVQSQLPSEAENLLQTMEVIPLKISGESATMDVGAILRRQPQVCLVDGLAYDNPPGSLHAKRWQDVEDLLAAGISVVASVNLQYIEDYREQAEKITGKRVDEAVPLGFLHKADEIEVVDAPPEICLEQGNGESPTGQSAQQLSELREIALLLAADVVDRQLESYLQRHGIEQLWGVQERILVLLRPGTRAAHMIESGSRNANRFHGELFAAYLDHSKLPVKDKSMLESDLALARQLGARVELLSGESLVDAVLRFARSRGITQIFVARSARETWWERLWGSDVDRLVSEAEGIDVRVFPN
ncbi:MAG TPA: sensor histidine kinase KdpD [Terriglobia bacterium]|nr:sensor histidine kinase KdpD [Terriglobia bacterium]